MLKISYQQRLRVLTTFTSISKAPFGLSTHLCYKLSKVMTLYFHAYAFTKTLRAWKRWYTREMRLPDC